MANMTSNETLYLNQDKTKVVKEGSADAAFLLVRKGGSLSAADAEKYGVGSARPERSLLEQEQDGLKAAEERGAFEEARVRRERVVSLDAEEKARKASANKARSSAPEDKGR